MKVATDSHAPGLMLLLVVAFVITMALAFIWPRSTTGNHNAGYLEDGTAVKGDTISLPLHASK